jgi:hypothetical protein
VLLAVDDDHIYYQPIHRDEVHRVAKTGGAGALVAAVSRTVFDRPGGVAADATHLYYVDVDGSVVRLGKSGGPPEILVDHGAANALSVEGGSVYYTTGAMTVACDDGAMYAVPADMVVLRRVSVRGGAVLDLVRDDTGRRALAVSSDSAYSTSELHAGIFVDSLLP